MTAMWVPRVRVRMDAAFLTACGMLFQRVPAFAQRVLSRIKKRLDRFKVRLVLESVEAELIDFVRARCFGVANERPCLSVQGVRRHGDDVATVVVVFA